MKKMNKNYCMSSYLAFRYIADDDKNFYDNMQHRVYRLPLEEDRILVSNAEEIDDAIEEQFARIRGKKIGMLLSGGMDSACLAPYLQGGHAYTFRFLNGEFQSDELERAEYFAKRYDLTLHYVDIDWNTVEQHVDRVMRTKGAPVHSIEPQILQAALQAKNDGIEIMVIGDAADYVFGGMDGLYAKDWEYNEFKKRYIYVNPEDVLVKPVDMNYAFEKYRIGDRIDFVGFMHEYTDIESYLSYENSFYAAKMEYIDPYELLKMRDPLDLNRIRNGQSKYLIRDLFKMKYPELEIPQKLPMPRPVDEYFKNWTGPKRYEFKKELNMTKFTGNQKWLLWCLERFLNNNEP